MDVRHRALRLFLSPPIVLVFGTIGVLFGAVSGMALSWDGSYYLFNALESQHSFEPHGRFVNALTQAPTIIAQGFTEQLADLRLVYGISYMAIPVLALVASWVVLRRRRKDMFAWPVLALFVATLPGQVNATCEALQSAQLVWPVLLAAIVGIDRDDRAVWFAVVITGVFAAVAHPFGVVLMGGVLLVARFRDEDGIFWVAAVLLWIAMANAWVTFDYYETDRMTMTVINAGLEGAIFGGPLIAIASSALGAALIAFGDRTRHRMLMGAVGVGCQVLAIAALVPWANDPLKWGGAIEFRTFTPAVIVPMALVAFFDGRRSEPADSRWRQFAAVTAAAGFALILAIQGLSVQRVNQTMLDAMSAASSGCTAQETIVGIKGTMLDHWSTPSRSLLFGTRAPTSMVLPGDQCFQLTDHGLLPLAEWDRRTVTAAGWFDLKNLGQKP